VDRRFSPWFGAMRWVAPFLLLLAAGGWNGDRDAPEFGLGHHPAGTRDHLCRDRGSGTGGGCLRGTVGRALSGILTDLFSAPGAFVLFVGLAIFGVIVAFGIPLRTAHKPAVGTARWMGTTAAASMRRTPAEEEDAADAAAAEAVAKTNGKNGRTNGKTVPAAPSPGQTGAWGDDENAIPTAIPSKGQTSNTFAPARGATSATLVPLRPSRDPDDVTDAGDSPLTKDHIEYILPPITVLEDVAVPVHAGGDEAAHARNEEIIVKKLAASASRPASSPATPDRS
jgi:hypothetical protein